MNAHYRAIHKHGESGSAAKQFLEIKLLIENIVNHAKSGNNLRQKIAYITTDHLVEIILNQTLLEVKEKPYNPASGIEVDAKTFSQLEGSFNKKLDFFSVVIPKAIKQGMVSSDVPIIEKETAEILKILHKYRNDIYHHNQINIKILKAFLSLFIIHNMKVITGFSRSDWETWDSNNKDVVDYCEENGPSPGFLNTHKAYVKLGKQLNIRKPPMGRLRNILMKDLQDRLQALIKEIDTLPKIKDTSIKIEAYFNQQALEEGLRMRLSNDSGYLKLTKLRKKCLKQKDYTQSAQIRTKLDEYVKKIRTNFSSNYSYRDLLLTQGLIDHLGLATTMSTLLKNYYTADQKLLIYRDLTTEIATHIEQEIQLAIDMMRGK